MSLIHWWPLNGDLQDKIQGKIFNNGGWTSASSGKIGTTYNANIGAILSASLSIPNTFSFACWVKNNDLTYPQAPLPMKFSNGAPYSTASTSNKGWEFSHGNNSKLTLNNGSTAQELNFGTPHVSYLGSWYHLVFTVDCHLKKASLFINGELKGEKSFTITDFSGTYTFSLGQIHGWKLDGFVNDLRIYDHALSQTEVKELSKALVVHYTFNDTCAESTTNIITGIKSARGKSSLYGNGVKVDWSAGGADSYFMFNYSQAIKANSVYTMSFDCEGLKSSEVVTFALSNLSAASYNIALKNGRNSFTFTAGSDLMNDINTHNRLFFDDKTRTDGAVFYLSNFQLEEKDHTTPYTPTSRDGMLVNEAGLSQPSTKNNILLSTDSGTGMYSLQCKGNTQVICTNTGDITQGVTVSFWVKCSIPSDSRLVFADNNSKIAFGFFNNGQAIITCAGYGHACVSNIRTNWNTEWNHIIVRRTSSNTVECYINGVKQNLSGSQEWTHSSVNSLSIGCRYSGGWTSYFTGLIDDFRYYNTCLSASDIAELYKTKAYITDQGDIEAHQFIEKTENIITEAEFAIPAKSTAGNGKIEIRNGVMAYGLQASTYYYAGDAESSNAIFKGKFKANTQYYFDLFMDVDTMWYSGGSRYVPGGFIVRYTDGTTVEVTTQSTDGANGWKRVQYYSNPEKSIYGLGIYYYIGTKWYLRHDSGIYEVDKDNAQITSKYTAETTQVAETSFETNALVHSSGNMVGREIIEI